MAPILNRIKKRIIDIFIGCIKIQFPQPLTSKGNSKFEILLVKKFRLKQETNQIRAVSIVKIKFCLFKKAVYDTSDCNWTRNHNHLVHKQTFNHLAKWLSVRLWTKWLWVRVQLQSLKLQISRLLQTRSSLTFRHLQSVDSLWNAYVSW